MLDTNMLMQHIPTGRQNAIHMNVLAALIGTNDRQVRKLVQKAREEEEIPILAGNEGYYLSDDPGSYEEAAFIRRRRKAARTTLRSVSCFEKRR